jgi:hypothetical protein
MFVMEVIRLSLPTSQKTLNGILYYQLLYIEIDIVSFDLIYGYQY